MDNEQSGTEYESNVLDSDFGERIAAMVEETVARSLEGLDIEAEIAKSLEGLNIDEIVNAEIEKAMHKVEHKLTKAKHRVHERAQKAHEKARRAQERAARAAERAARHAERHTRVKVDMQDGEPDVPPKVSDEEQLRILRMLQEGTITAEQADMLLNALAA